MCSEERPLSVERQILRHSSECTKFEHHYPITSMQLRTKTQRQCHVKDIENHLRGETHHEKELFYSGSCAHRRVRTSCL